MGVTKSTSTVQLTASWDCPKVMRAAIWGGSLALPLSGEQRQPMAGVTAAPELPSMPLGYCAATRSSAEQRAGRRASPGRASSGLAVAIVHRLAQAVELGREFGDAGLERGRAKDLVKRSRAAESATTPANAPDTAAAVPYEAVSLPPQIERVLGSLHEGKVWLPNVALAKKMRRAERPPSQARGPHDG